MRKNLNIINIFLLVFIVISGYWLYSYERSFSILPEYVGKPEYKSLDRDVPLDKQSATVQIGGKTLEIPSVYIQTDLRGQSRQDSLNLLYVYPEFTSRVDFENREEYYAADEQERFGHMFIEKSGIKAPLERALELTRNSASKVEDKNNVYGLEHEVWYRQKKGKLLPYYDIYIERDNNNQILSYIDCTPQERGAHIESPGCSHKFFNKGLYYSIYYNKEKYLSSWADIKQAAINFINNFETGTAL